MKYMLIPFFLIVLAFGAHADLTTGLVSYYKFDNNANDSVGSYHGTVSGAVNTTGKINNGYDFDGINDYVGVGDLMGFLWDNNTITVAGWFKAEAFGSYNTFIASCKSGGAGGFTFWYKTSEGSSIDFVKIGVYALSYPIALNTSQWYHIVGVANNTGMFLYLNGNLVTSNSNTANFIDSTTDNTTIGAYWDNTGLLTHFMNGVIDEVVIWNRALNETEITMLYNLGQGVQYFNYPPNISDIVCTSVTPDDDQPPYMTDDITPTFTFYTHKNAWCRISNSDTSYSDMSYICQYGEGGLNHTCSFPEEVEYQGTNYLHLACVDVFGSEHNASNNYDLELIYPTEAAAIEIGIKGSIIWPGAVIHTDQQVYLRDLNNNQKLATIDKVAVYGNQRWLLNYENSTALGLFNLTPVVYSLDLTGNMTYTQIKDAVEAFIASTKN